MKYLFNFFQLNTFLLHETLKDPLQLSRVLTGLTFLWIHMILFNIQLNFQALKNLRTYELMSKFQMLSWLSQNKHVTPFLTHPCQKLQIFL